MHLRNFLSIWLCVILSAWPVAARRQDDALQTSSRIAGSILVGGRSMYYARELSDGFGGRLPGSRAYERAARWAAEQFRAAGIPDVRLEPLTIPNGWERGPARGRMLAPLERPLHLDSLGWSIPTPPGGLRGEVADVPDVSPEAIRAGAEKLRGRVAILHTGAIFAGGWYEGYPRLLRSYGLLKEAGAAAVLVPSWESNNLIMRLDMNGCRPTPLPVAQLGMEDARLIRRLLEKGPVGVELELENRLTGPVEVSNVVAEIRGREAPDEWLVVGAHLDSWDAGTGAQDNATGCAMVLEAARAIAALGRPPRRSVRFALWAGEEEGYLGSLAYVRAHRKELAGCVAALNTDSGAGHPLGWRTLGRDDVMSSMKAISQTLLSDLGGAELAHDAEQTFYSDQGPFILEGIPALDLKVDPAQYDGLHHLPGDTFDKVNAHHLAAGSAVVAVTAYAIAERAGPLAPRLGRPAVEQMITKGGMGVYVREVIGWR